MTEKHLIQTAVILAAVSAFGLRWPAHRAALPPPIPDTLKVENVKDHVITVQSSEEVKVVPRHGRAGLLSNHTG